MPFPWTPSLIPGGKFPFSRPPQEGSRLPFLSLATKRQQNKPDVFGRSFGRRVPVSVTLRVQVIRIPAETLQPDPTGRPHMGQESRGLCRDVGGEGGLFQEEPQSVGIGTGPPGGAGPDPPPAAAGGGTPWPMWQGTANLPEPGALRVSAPSLPAPGGRRPFRGRAPAGPAGPVSYLPGTAPALPALRPLRFSLGLPGSLLPVAAAPGSRSAKRRRRLGAEGWAADLLAQGGTTPPVQAARRESFLGSGITEGQPGWQEKRP